MQEGQKPCLLPASGPGGMQGLAEKAARPLGGTDATLPSDSVLEHQMVIMEVRMDSAQQ